MHPRVLLVFLSQMDQQLARDARQKRLVDHRVGISRSRFHGSAVFGDLVDELRASMTA